MIKLSDKSQCCGCTACASICPKNAIVMVPDGMGFKYPKVDVLKCTECGLCENVCSFNENYDKSSNLNEPIIFAARHKDIHEVETSRSGAAFIAISDYVLDNGGIVYGVGYKEHFRVAHKRAITKEERNEFKGSKYVQSDLEGIFAQIREDLKNGNTVLFSGTPCQTAGLNSFIGKKLRENLILVDIVCHGVPSPYIWRDYIEYIENKYKSKITKVDFRDKTRIGWAGHIESFVMSNGEKIESNIYADLFCNNIMLRQSCGICHYTNLNRPSDFTIADYWGWENVSDDFNSDDKGCSLLFINSSKGQSLFQNFADKLNLIRSNQEKCLQPNLMEPSALSLNSHDFECDYINHGFIYILNKYGNLYSRNILGTLLRKFKTFRILFWNWIFK